MSFRLWSVMFNSSCSVDCQPYQSLPKNRSRWLSFCHNCTRCISTLFRFFQRSRTSRSQSRLGRMTAHRNILKQKVAGHSPSPTPDRQSVALKLYYSGCFEVFIAESYGHSRVGVATESLTSQISPSVSIIHTP